MILLKVQNWQSWVVKILNWVTMFALVCLGIYKNRDYCRNCFCILYIIPPKQSIFFFIYLNFFGLICIFYLTDEKLVISRNRNIFTNCFLPSSILSKTEELYLFLSFCGFRFSQTRQVLQMEEDVDLELIHEREEAIRKLEVCLVLQYNIFYHFL